MKRRVRTHGAAGAAQVWAVAVAATFVGATACGGLVEGQGAGEASLLAGTSGEADVATTTEETLDAGHRLIPGGWLLTPEPGASGGRRTTGRRGGHA